MTWTHNICLDCWNKREPWGRKPVQILKAKTVICCFCGLETSAGIYVRQDPKELSCSHTEEG